MILTKIFEKSKKVTSMHSKNNTKLSKKNTQYKIDSVFIKILQNSNYKPAK